MFEHRHEPLLPHAAFMRRVVRFTAIGLLIVVGALYIGVLGYHFTERYSWVDSFLNAAMILGGMGPVNTLTTVAGKLFAGIYALFSGIVFLIAIGIIIAPLAHRIFHHFHLEMDDAPGEDEG